MNAATKAPSPHQHWGQEQRDGKLAGPDPPGRAPRSPWQRGGAGFQIILRLPAWEAPLAPGAPARLGSDLEPEPEPEPDSALVATST